MHVEQCKQSNYLRIGFKDAAEANEACEALKGLITVQKISNRSFLAAVSLVLQAINITKKSTFTEMLTPEKTS